MFKLRYQSSQTVVIKDFKQNQLPLVVLSIAFVTAILLLALKLDVVAKQELLMLIVASAILVIAFVAKYKNKVYLYNADTVKEALVLAFIIAAVAVVASSVLYIFAGILFFIATIIFGGIFFILFLVLMSAVAFVFVLPVVLYVAVALIIIIFLVKLFSNKVETVEGTPKDSQLNIEKLRKSLKNKDID